MTTKTSIELKDAPAEEKDLARRVSTDFLAILLEIGDVLKDVPQIVEGYGAIDESDNDYFLIGDGWNEDDTEKWRQMTDDEMKSLYPVTWTRRKIAEILFG